MFDELDFNFDFDTDWKLEPPVINNRRCVFFVEKEPTKKDFEELYKHNRLGIASNYFNDLILKKPKRTPFNEDTFTLYNAKREDVEHFKNLAKKFNYN